MQFVSRDWILQESPVEPARKGFSTEELAVESLGIRRSTSDCHEIGDDCAADVVEGAIGPLSFQSPLFAVIVRMAYLPDIALVCY